jgi:integrase
MARGIHKLSAGKVAGTTKPGMHSDGGGLYLRVKPAAGGGVSKSWFFRYGLNHKGHRIGLGSARDRTLAEARDKAAELRKLLLDKVDPVIERQRQRAEQLIASRPPVLFREAAIEYLKTHDAKWSPRHARDWLDTLERFAFPALGKLPVDRIDVDAVLGVLKPQWLEKHQTVSRLRGRIESIMGSAIARNLHPGPNPASWTVLKHLLPASIKNGKKHFEALPYAQVAGFTAELRKIDSVASYALQFAILTAARTGEIRDAVWSEISLQTRTWTIPPKRMKTGKEHKVPLSDAAVAILERMRELRTGDTIFPFGAAEMRRTIKRAGYSGITPHGFRSSFRDWAAERTNTQNFVVEMALAHAIPSGVEAAYRRGDLFEKRRRLMDQWATFCATPAVTGEVVPMKRA